MCRHAGKRDDPDERYPSSMRSSPIRVTILGILAVIVFQSFVVQGRGGNWTSLFCAGDKLNPPPDLVGEMYQFHDSHGFDGQFYFYIARDLMNARNTSAYVDFPAMRWLRALVPGSAALLAFGDPDRVIYTYIGIMWGLCAFGIWLSVSICRHWGYPEIAGLGFLAIPAVLVSLDRMMTDLALVVVLLALIDATLREKRGWVYVALVLAPLARETGLALTGGWVLYQLWRREWRSAFLGCLTVLPFLGWLVYVIAKFGSGGGFFLGTPFLGIVRRLFTPVIYDVSTIGLKLAAIADYVGAWGIAVSFLATVVLFVRGERSLLIFCALVYTLGIALFTKEDMWGEAYSYARTGGPVALLLALFGLERRRWWLLVPMLLALPRILLQYGFVSWGALRAWW